MQTASGPVCGIVENGTVSYFGVPYAAAPVGTLRWAPPQQHAPWTTTFEATQPGSVCPQPGIAGAAPAPNQSEDCLNLNVQRPTGSVSGLPVIVDIHFGGFITGGALDSSELAAQGRVVTVSMNYRLGILGFLAHSGLGAHSGDYGLQDQYAALRWVRQNITAFGGDPSKVTIEGSSAGGASVCDAIVSPQARGLFRSGISESGFYNYNVNTVWWPADCKSTLQSEAQAQQEGDAFAAKVGCGLATNVVACLRAVPVDTLIADAGQVEAPFAGGAIGPIVNGTTLPLSPATAIATGRFDHNVSLIIGVARDEFNGGEYNDSVVANTPGQYQALVSQQFKSMTSAVIARYPLERFPDSSPFIAYRTIMADAFSVCPALHAEQQLARRIPVYAYEFDDANSLHPNDGLPLGSPHSGQATYLFPSAYGSVQFNPDQAPFRDQLIAEWAGLAYTGSPTVAGTPFWPRFQDGQNVMSLVPAGDSTPTPASTIATQHNCGFWANVERRLV
ncbi:MAG: carboxylesterase family protein, partial [Solirubrobacterales bacterium]|nr:carboxylesterase family protein [Solirubrobacterales bacterium]